MEKAKEESNEWEKCRQRRCGAWGMSVRSRREGGEEAFLEGYEVSSIFEKRHENQQLTI